MNLITIFRTAQSWGPVLFGIGFIAPLIAQTLDAASAPSFLGLTHLQLGFAIALPTSFLAKVRGSWI